MSSYYFAPAFKCWHAFFFITYFHFPFPFIILFREDGFCLKWLVGSLFVFISEWQSKNQKVFDRWATSKLLWLRIIDLNKRQYIQGGTSCGKGPAFRGGCFGY